MSAGAALATSDLAGLTVLGKTALALGLVAACILLCGWLVSRFGVRPGASGDIVRVIGGARLGQREKVVVVEVRGRWLVLGVTAQQVACLSDLEAPPPSDQALVETPARGFALRLADALKRGGNRGQAPRP